MEQLTSDRDHELRVLIQAGILVALFVSVRKTSARMEEIVTDLHKKTAPILESTQSIVVDSRRRSSHHGQSAGSFHLHQVASERLDATVSDAVDRTRLQIIRADDLVTRTMTAWKRQRSRASLGEFAGSPDGRHRDRPDHRHRCIFRPARREEREDSPQDEEMFI